MVTGASALLGDARGLYALTLIVAGVVSVSTVLFFSASIPCILSTSIPLSVDRMLVVWFIRVTLNLLLAVPAGYLVQTLVV